MNQGRSQVAVVGATGLVGQACIRLLLSKNIKVVALASCMPGERFIEIDKRSYKVVCAEHFDYRQVDVALMCVRAEVSEALSPKIIQAGCRVVDNSSHYRQDLKIPLVVPGIGSPDVYAKAPLIASPNCVAIPLAITLQALSSLEEIEEVWGSTYQSVSGEGHQAMVALKHQRGMHNNVLAQIGKMGSDNISGEEEKIAFEVNRILGQSILISVMAVRVPIEFGHSMHIRIQYTKRVNLGQAIELLAICPYIKLYTETVPQPSMVRECNLVHIGRVRQIKDNALDLWVVSDNLYRGAASNVCEIFDRLL